MSVKCGCIVLCVLAAFVLGRTADARQDKRPKHVIREYRDAANLDLAQLNTMDGSPAPALA